jgi:hypothetical protein
MKPWPEQVDELVKDGSYSAALALLDTLDETALPDKVYIIFLYVIACILTIGFLSRSKLSRFVL